MLNDYFSTHGIVRETLPGCRFKVELLNEFELPYGYFVTATISGKLRIHFIRILVGDKVILKVSKYDSKNGRIIWRYK